jgi:hypothetical protein
MTYLASALGLSHHFLRLFPLSAMTLHTEQCTKKSVKTDIYWRVRSAFFLCLLFIILADFAGRTLWYLSPRQLSAFLNWGSSEEILHLLEMLAEGGDALLFIVKT